MPPDASRTSDPLAAFRFKVEILGMVEAGFSEVSGLQAETETEDYREGGVNDYVHKLAKGTKHQNVTLKRGMTGSAFLWIWYQGVISGKIIPMNIHISLQDALKKTKWQWALLNAYPVKWSGPDFKADSNNIAFETLELVHEGIMVLQPLAALAVNAITSII